LIYHDTGTASSFNLTLFHKGFTEWNQKPPLARCEYHRSQSEGYPIQ